MTKLGRRLTTGICGRAGAAATGAAGLDVLTGAGLVLVCAVVACDCVGWAGRGSAWDLAGGRGGGVLATAGATLAGKGLGNSTAGLGKTGTFGGVGTDAFATGSAGTAFAPGKGVGAGGGAGAGAGAEAAARLTNWMAMGGCQASGSGCARRSRSSRPTLTCSAMDTRR
ncbi:hypothetical protein D9M71_450410 [compost metagenome]